MDLHLMTLPCESCVGSVRTVKLDQSRRYRERDSADPPSRSSPCALVLKTVRQSNNVVAPINMQFATMNITPTADKWYCTGGALLSPRP